jgi:hypothetical protein
LLSGLSTIDYPGSVQEIRQLVLQEYSEYIISNLFNSNNLKTKNIPATYNWLCKLLG